jgi:opine dehydrogenase
MRIKGSVPVAACQAHRTAELLEALRPALPHFVAGDHVLKTSLNGIGCVLRPAIMTLNAGRIERGGETFRFYVDGVTARVARVMEALDAERVAVAEALGCRCFSARQWLYFAYDASGDTLYDAIRANPTYRDFRGPVSVNHRFLHEDVPFGLVPIASLGEWLGVPTPEADSIIRLASALTDRDFRAEGRTVERMGLAGRTVRDVQYLVETGRFPDTDEPTRPRLDETLAPPLPVGGDEPVGSRSAAEAATRQRVPASG